MRWQPRRATAHDPQGSLFVPQFLNDHSMHGRVMDAGEAGGKLVVTV
jgi:hypothetical protein